MSWSKWWWVKNRLSIWVGDIPILTSLYVVAGPQSNMRRSSPTWSTYDDPNLFLLALGLPAPRMNSLFMSTFSTSFFVTPAAVIVERHP